MENFIVIQHKKQTFANRNSYIKHYGWVMGTSTFYYAKTFW